MKRKEARTGWVPAGDVVAAGRVELLQRAYRSLEIQEQHPGAQYTGLGTAKETKASAASVWRGETVAMDEVFGVELALHKSLSVCSFMFVLHGFCLVMNL